MIPPNLMAGRHLPSERQDCSARERGAAIAIALLPS